MPPEGELTLFSILSMLGGAILASVFGLLLLCAGCDPGVTMTAANQLDGVMCPFNIYWPLRDPEENLPKSERPLLHGQLALEAKPAAGSGDAIWLDVTIARGAEEADRQFWNSRLAFADIAWMDQVRVWDTDEKWLWPNLPYLLRLPGVERVERYGGIDPGKGVDNDFAAVLIRKYDARGEVEASETITAPLVSAEWHATGMEETDLQTVVPTANSDRFLLHLGSNAHSDRGQIKIWIIYADFLGTRSPYSWPREGEWAGGILAYFEIDWEKSPGERCRGTVRNKRPEASTRFGWEKWVRNGAPARLNDMPTE